MADPRKIDLSKRDYLCPGTMVCRGGDENCDHDYPDETTDTHNGTVEWFTCTKCGMRTGFEVYD